MITPNDIKKYKYLVLKVDTEAHAEGTALYKYTHTVHGIDDCEYPLGYYDAYKKHPVVIMTNTSVVDYDWCSVVERIKTATPSYIDKFENIKNIILVTNTLDNDTPTMRFVSKQCIIQICNEKYYKSLLPELEIAPKKTDKHAYTADQQKNAEERWKKLYTSSNDNLDKKILFNNELKSRNSHTNDDMAVIGLLAAFLICISIVLTISAFSDACQNRVSSSVEDMQVTSTVTRHDEPMIYKDGIDQDSLAEYIQTVDDSIKMYQDSIAQYKKDSILLAWQLEKVRQDSIANTLREERKVNIKFTAVLEDGITTREVRTEVVLDTIKESDMNAISKVINEMATNMAKDRQTEIDTSRHYYATPLKTNDGYIALN